MKLEEAMDGVLYTYSIEYVEKANKSCRDNSAFGAKAITPKYILENECTDKLILDFGAGKNTIHTNMLRDEGFEVVAHEFGNNLNENHDPFALNKKYEVVYASNVLNVQSDDAMFDETLNQIVECVAEGGVFYGNYPQSPRYANLSVDEVWGKLEARFTEVERVGGSKSAPLFKATL